jgi:predicted transcriptional regulator
VKRGRRSHYGYPLGYYYKDGDQRITDSFLEKLHTEGLLDFSEDSLGRNYVLTPHGEDLVTAFKLGKRLG